MRSMKILKRLGLAGGWTQQLLLGAIALAVGFAIMPLLIFFAGSWALGRYEGASISRMYQGIYRGLEMGSVASWIVVLGPCGLYLTFKGLRAWWRAGAHVA